MDYAALKEKKEFLAKHINALPQAILENYEKAFAIEFAHHSTAIEGNTLSLMETKLVLEDKLPVMNNLSGVTTPQQLRAWLTENAAAAKEAWVRCTRGETPGRLYYLDVVEQCLCFGWIDSTQKSAGDGVSLQRISPRSKGGNWTELNKERVCRLERLGQMTDAGRKVLPDMGGESFVVEPQVLSALMEDAQVWENYLAMPELYRRIRIDTIQWCLKTKQPELYETRLRKFIDATRQNKMYGAWNDDGRLLD